MKKKIVAFAGSNSSKSINKELVKYVLTHFTDCDQNLLDLNDFKMVLYSVDEEGSNGIPEKAKVFAKHMAEADAIICSLAEHNQSYTVAFKNIFDWCSRNDVKIFADKPMLLMSTSPGGYGGGNVMKSAKASFPSYGANVIGTFSLPSFTENFKNNEISDATLKASLMELINDFKKQL